MYVYTYSQGRGGTFGARAASPWAQICPKRGACAAGLSGAPGLTRIQRGGSEKRIIYVKISCLTGGLDPANSLPYDCYKTDTNALGYFIPVALPVWRPDWCNMEPWLPCSGFQAQTRPCAASYGFGQSAAATVSSRWKRTQPAGHQLPPLCLLPGLRDPLVTFTL